MGQITQVGVEAVVKNVDKFVGDLGRMQSATQQVGLSATNAVGPTTALGGRFADLRNRAAATRTGLATLAAEESATAGKTDLLGMSVSRLAGIGLAALVAGAAKAVWELAMLGAEAQRLEDAFPQELVEPLARYHLDYVGQDIGGH